MSRPFRPEDHRLWALVTATVRPHSARRRAVRARSAEAGPEAPVETAPLILHPQPAEARISGAPKPRPPPETIEPGRKRRIAREREEIAARLDLHGLDQDRARLAVHAFIRRAQNDGARAVLIITGKGSLGDGILRRRAPEWLAEPEVRDMVAGLSHAERHHGGEGALYVALKRPKPR